MHRLISLFLLAVNFFDLGAAEPATLETVGVANSQFHFRLRGVANQDYALEASSNLTDWVEVRRIKTLSELFELAEPQIGSHRFFRAKTLVLENATLATAQTELLAGDGTLVRVPGDGAATWRYTVNGIVNGNDAVGRILPDPAVPGQ